MKTKLILSLIFLNQQIFCSEQAIPSLETLPNVIENLILEYSGPIHHKLRLIKAKKDKPYADFKIAALQDGSIAYSSSEIVQECKYDVMLTQDIITLTRPSDLFGQIIGPSDFKKRCDKCYFICRQDSNEIYCKVLLGLSNYRIASIDKIQDNHHNQVTFRIKIYSVAEKIFNLLSPIQEQTINLKEEVYCLVELSANRLAGATDNSIIIWDLNNRTLEKEYPIAEVKCLAFDKNNNKLICGAVNKLIILDLSDGSHVSYTLPQVNPANRYKPTIKSVTSLPNNKVAFYTVDPFLRNIIQIRDTISGQPIRELNGHTKNITALDALPNNFLVSGSEDCTVKIWHAPTGTCINTINFDKAVRTLITSNTQVAVTLHNDFDIHIFDIPSQSYYKKLDGMPTCTIL